MKFKRNKKFVFILTFVFSFLLLIGCVFVLTDKTYFSFIFSLTIPILVIFNLFFLFYWLFKKKIKVLYPVFGLFVFFLCFNFFFQININDEASNIDSFSLFCYNARGFNERREIKEEVIDQKIQHFIEQQNVDILCFQEFSGRKYHDFDDTYPYRFVGWRKGIDKSMQAIFSKFEILNRGYVDFPDTLNNAMFVDVEYKQEVIRIYNLHLQSFGVSLGGHRLNLKRFFSIFNKVSEAQKARIEQTKMVLNHSKKFKGPVIICGDFNSTPFSSTYKTLKADRKDTFIEAGAGFGKTYSLFNYPLRLDYVLVSDDFDVVSHQNFDLKLSDHEPILVELVKN